MTVDLPASARQRSVAGPDARPPSSPPARPARSGFDLWQAHARRSFEAACRSAPGGSDTVHLFNARRQPASHEFARRLSLATALRRAGERPTMRTR